MVALLTFALALALAPHVGEEPFPVTTTTLKTDGRLFYVEGRVTLARTEKVVSLRATTISGRGEGATLVVSGELELRAVTGGQVILQDLRIELAPDFEALSMIDCELRGTSVVHSVEDGAHEGKIYLGKTKFSGKTELDLRMSGGAVNIVGSSFDRPVRVLGVPRSEKLPSQVEVNLLSCNGRDVGVFGGLRIEGAKECHLAFSDIGGSEIVLIDCATLEIDGNNLRARRLELRQTDSGRFGETTVKRCDVRAQKIALLAPRKPGLLEKAVFSECWFGGGTDEDALRAERFEDAANVPESGVEASLKKIREAAVGLGGDRE